MPNDPEIARLLTPHLAGQGSVAQEHATSRLRQGSVGCQASDDVSGTGDSAPGDLDPLRYVVPDDPGARGELAVDPDLAMVVDVRLEEQLRIGYGNAVDLLGQLHRDAPPPEPVHIFNQDAIPRWLERFGGKPAA